MTRFSILMTVAMLGVASIRDAASVPVAGDNQSLRAVSTTLNQFAVDFYKQAAEEQSDNLICSPVSVSMVLSMAAFGAGGETAQQMRTGLHLPADDAVTKSGFASIIDSLNSVKKVQLQLANKIFTDSGFEVKQSFKDVTANSFKSASQTLNFGEANAASATINSWCSAQTNGLVKEVIQPDDLASAAMVLVNAVYFKGQWKNKFHESETQSDSFHLTEKSSVDVPMMHKLGKFNYGSLQDLDAQYVELPYQHENQDDATSMFIILPNKIEGLKTAESALHNVDFKELHETGRMTNMHLHLPKFKASSTLNLVPTLTKMGMDRMFSSAADFTGIADSPPLKISKVIQKAVIEVNEEGSEAAAVTAVIAVSYSLPAPPSPPITLKIDRPYIYAIVHRSTNTILFQGHITKPAY